MILERNQVVVGIVFAALIAVGTVFAVGFSDDVLRSGYRVSIELADAEGLAPGDDVMLAGLRAGTVEDVALDGDHVAVRARVTAEVPADSRAQLVLRNLVGKRAIELVPGDDWGHLLEEMDEPRIPLDRTDGLVDVPDLADETVALLRDADTEALRALVTSLADVTEGQRDEVGELLDGLSRVSAVLAEKRDALQRLITRSEDLVDAAADRDEQIVTIIDEFGSTLDVLNRNRDELTRLLTETAGASSVTADLVREERARLDRVLDEVHEVLEIVDDHQVDLAHTMAYGGVSFYGFSQVGRSGEEDTPYWGNILTTGIGDAGIDAFAGCGGAVDRFLDQIFGPAECPEEGDRTAGPQEGAGGDAAAPAPSSLGALFQLEVTR